MKTGPINKGMRAGFLIITAAAVAAVGCGRLDRAEPAPSARQADIELAKDFRLAAARVPDGATLASVLRTASIGEDDIAAVVARAASVFDLRKFRASQPYRIEQWLDGRLRAFEYEIDGDRFLRVARSRDNPMLTAEVVTVEKTHTVDVVRGTIDRATPSLFAAIEATGETIDLAVSLAEVFSGEIDFNVDLRPGDRFELLVEKRYRDRPDGAPGEPKMFAGYGPIVAAAFDNAGRQLRAARFRPDGGVFAYYDERGVSMRRFFLQSPLKFVPVITSRFSRSRLHPILREYRPHLGVDYKAPIGAPVVAVADGVVVEAGVNGGAGRMVHLRHANSFESEYLHLSSIAVRRGARVRQGDLIGRVGASGLATGPHLDYRLKKNGAFINPLTAHRSLPPGDPVPADQMTAFASARDDAFARLAGITPAVTVASAPAVRQH
jgi:murein DD-endopeptidase MepM/ murein hydrolase activator NlpD